MRYWLLTLRQRKKSRTYPDIGRREEGAYARAEARSEDDGVAGGALHRGRTTQPQAEPRRNVGAEHKTLLPTKNIEIGSRVRFLCARAGFTLIETIVVVTLFSIIAAGLSASFLSGMKIWSRAQNINVRQNEVIVDLEKMTKELHQSLNMPLIGFEGNASEISFPNLIGNNIVQVRYRFNSDDKMLLRSQTDLKDILKKQEGEEGGEEETEESKEINVMHLEGFTLSYLHFDSEASEYAWTDVWTKEKGIFNAVKLEIKTADETVTKTIFIPVVN